MGKSLISRVTGIIIIISFMLIVLTVASVYSEDTTGTTTEEDYEQILDESLDEISTIFLIKDQKGLYERIDQNRCIEKLGLWITPLVTQDIDISQMHIQIDDGEKVKFLSYYGESFGLDENDIFNNDIWGSLNGSVFSFISIVDLDDSLKNNNMFNDYSDNAYLLIKLPTDMTLEKYEKMTIRLFPSVGNIKNIEISAPFSTRSIVTL